MPEIERLQRRALDRAFAVATGQVADGRVPFVVLGVADSVGTIRLEASAPDLAANPGTGAICAIASITKPIVATTVMQLVEAGRFQLDEPLRTWLPELDATGRRPFTAWHVLSHTSGLEDVDVAELLTAGAGRDALLRAAVAAEQPAAPGTRHRYVSTTFDLLAEAVARAVGTPFETLVRDGVTGPLGMPDTTFDPRPDPEGRVAPIALGPAGLAAATHGTVDPGLLAHRFMDLRLAGGGLWSTASDLLRFGRAILRGGELDGARVLSPAFVELMTREATNGGLGMAPDRLDDEHYALGWVRRSPAGIGSADAFGHGGVTGTRLWIDPAWDLVFVYLTGAWGMSPQPSRAALHAVYGALRRGPSR